MQLKKSMAIVLMAASLFGDCRVISSPAQNLGLIAGVDGFAMTIPKFYYDAGGKMQMKGYQDAYIEFFKKASNYIQTSCKKYNIKNIYNFKIESNVDKDSYYFNALFDFEYASKK